MANNGEAMMMGKGGDGGMPEEESEEDGDLVVFLGARSG